MADWDSMSDREKSYAEWRAKCRHLGLIPCHTPLCHLQGRAMFLTGDKGRLMATWYCNPCAQKRDPQPEVVLT